MKSKLLMSGFNNVLEKRGVSVWHNREKKIAIVVKNDKVELSCGKVKHWVDLETSSLYIVGGSSGFGYNGLKVYGELLNGSGKQKASLFIANGEDCMKPIPRMET